MKDLLVVVAGTGERKPVTVQPGTTTRDLLDQLGLYEYALSRDGDPANILPSNADLFPMVEDGQKLWASTQAIVGSRAG